MTGRKLFGVLVAAVAVILGLLGAETAAAAHVSHAQLLSISPDNGEIVKEEPTAVVLTFDEHVSLTGGSARVLNDDATVVSAAASVSGSELTIPLEPDLPDGTYTVTWRVISADSHPITWASVFHIGAPTSAGLVDAALDDGVDEVAWGVRFGAILLMGVGYAGALSSFGLWWFSRVVLAPAEVNEDAGGDDAAETARPMRSVLRPAATRAAVIGATTMLASVPFRVARVGGGLSVLSNNDVFESFVRGPIGASTAVTVVGLLVGAVFAGRSTGAFRSWWCGLAGAVALAGFIIEGHTRTKQPRWAMVAFDGVHLLAGACWLGGVAALVLVYRTLESGGLRSDLVRRFSTWALGLVVSLATAGVVMAWIILSSWHELTDTGWGLALLVKVALVVVVVGIGAYNRFGLVPSMSRRLRSTVSIELVLLLAVVGVTAVLVTRSPVRPLRAAGSLPTSATSSAPAQSVDVELSGGAGTATIEVTPAAKGANRIDLELVDPDGNPIDPVEEPVVELTQLALDIGPLKPAVVRSPGAGTYEVVTDFSADGDWEITVRVRVSDFVSAAGTTTITIEG